MKSRRMEEIGRKNKMRRFKPNEEKEIDNLLSSMRMVRQVKKLAETLSVEEKEKVIDQLETTVENIKRGLDRLK